jgi:hypothetical protein
MSLELDANECEAARLRVLRERHRGSHAGRAKIRFETREALSADGYGTGSRSGFHAAIRGRAKSL